MAVDPELLELLVCPRSKGELTTTPLPPSVCERLVARYREHFAGEQPEVSEGLWCRESGLVYPIVSDMPIMLIEEALPAAEVLPEAASEGDTADES
ncbi:MAG: hypothetical protein OXG74_21695 [Acidobacteria bacterium]|nr:hypothetical protein [Acidobacteriota bacterium]